MCVHVCVFVYVCVYVCEYVYVCVYVCVFVYVCVQMCVCVRADVCVVCMYVVCMYLCRCKCICDNYYCNQLCCIKQLRNQTVIRLMNLLKMT